MSQKNSTIPSPMEALKLINNEILLFSGRTKRLTFLGGVSGAILPG